MERGRQKIFVTFAKVRDKASMLSGPLLLFLENCHEIYIKNVEKTNSIGLDSIENSCL